MLVAPRGLDHNPFYRMVLEDPDQFADMDVAVGNGDELPQRMKSDIELGFADIDADVDFDLVFLVGHNKLTLPCYTGSRPSRPHPDNCPSYRLKSHAALRTCYRSLLRGAVAQSSYCMKALNGR